LYDAMSAGYKISGIEYSKDAYDYLKRQGLNVYLGEFENVDVYEEKFDIITAIAVLEHVRDPMAFFRKISSCLKPGGVFFYVTANFDSLISKILGPKWNFIEPDRHLYYFTPSVIASYLNKVGLRPMYLKDSFDTGRKLTRYIMKIGMLGKERRFPETFVEKLIFRSLNLLDDIRNTNMPYAAKD